MQADGGFAPYGIRDDCNSCKIVRGVEDAAPYGIRDDCNSCKIVRGVEDAAPYE